MIDYSSIERKWQEEWEKAKIFESDPDDRKSYLVTAAFPYVNSPQHMGHLRTYGTADVLARYKRMQGFNVLYPMGFHGTGTPILAIAKRIKDNDQDLIRDLKMFHISDLDISKMSDPNYVVDYISNEIGSGMRLSGLSIDWRRTFKSTEPFFGKFIEWQFGILGSKGYLVQGKHPVGWCPNENNAVGMHDTLHDVEPEIEEETAIKFRLSDEDAYLMCSTYRPETIDGATNIFVKSDAKYVLCRIDGQNYYIAKSAAESLFYQRQIEVLKEIDGSSLLKRKCINPFNGEVLPIFPGYFVKEGLGTGTVMSVPAHAPFDYAALERLKAGGYDVGDIKYKKIIDVQIGQSLGGAETMQARPTHLDIPSLAYLEVLKTDVNAVEDMLEFATKTQYREESHFGKMLIKGYEGMSESEARGRIKKKLADEGNATTIYIIQNAPVMCRCGYKVVVKIVDNQWFLNYGDKQWKATVKSTFEGIRVLPERARNGLAAAIDWIDLRAVARAQGLGTRFPLDKSFIIESLSDSTIYMAWYTILHLLRDLDMERLKPELFDYVFLGKGGIEDVAKATGIELGIIKKCRDSFEYWYTYTSRHSGPDLIFNHLTMQIFNHVAIFDEKYWPKQIVVNGMVMYEGEKMSKSLGNIVPLADAIRKMGADPLRIVELTSSDLFSDSEYRENAINGVKERLDYLFEVVRGVDGKESGGLGHIDYWLYSKLNRKIDAVTAAMESLELREYSTEGLYNSVIELRHYFERGGSNGVVIRDFMQAVVLMMQPMAPHFAEEMWHLLGNSKFASLEKWPISDKEMINDKIESEENLVLLVMEDAKRASDLIVKKSQKAAKRIVVVVASDWKRNAQNLLSQTKNPGATISKIKEDGIDPASAAAYVGKLAREVNRIRKVEITQGEEFAVLDGAKGYIGESLGTSIFVEKEGESKSARAERAAPLKPSLEIVF